MYIRHSESIREDWDQVKSWNYKLPSTGVSVVYAEVNNEHGEVTSKDSTWVYYIIDGVGEFTINNEIQAVATGDVITVPANTAYNYKSTQKKPLKVVMFIDLWNN